jgi:hypothetical protein
MHIVFCIWPASAHQNPVVALAWSLEVAGHEAVVRFASLPSTERAMQRRGPT